MSNNLTRVVNKTVEEYEVYIGRGSKWGNPFTHRKLEDSKAIIQVDSRNMAIEKYEQWILGLIDIPGTVAPAISEIRKELKNKILGCFCKPKKCHGDILVKICSWKDEEVEGKILALREYYISRIEIQDLF